MRERFHGNEGIGRIRRRRRARETFQQNRVPVDTPDFREAADCVDAGFDRALLMGFSGYQLETPPGAEKRPLACTIRHSHASEPTCSLPLPSAACPGIIAETLNGKDASGVRVRSRQRLPQGEHAIILRSPKSSHQFSPRMSVV